MKPNNNDAELLALVNNKLQAIVNLETIHDCDITIFCEPDPDPIPDDIGQAVSDGFTKGNKWAWCRARICATANESEHIKGYYTVKNAHFDGRDHFIGTYNGFERGLKKAISNLGKGRQRLEQMHKDAVQKSD